MQILKYGEIARYFTSEDLEQNEVVSLTNKFENEDITSSICNGEIHQQGTRVSLEVTRTGSTEVVSTTKYLNYVIITLNTNNASKSYLNKELTFKCKTHLLDFISDYDLVVIGNDEHRSWSLVSINNGRFEFYDNDDLNNITNTFHSSAAYQKDEWTEFKILSAFDSTDNVYRYNILINGTVVAHNITGKKLDDSTYDDSSLDDSLMLFNVDPLKTVTASRNNVIFKDIVLCRQYEKRLKTPEVKISHTRSGNYFKLQAEIKIDPYIIEANLDETGKGYTCQWEGSDSSGEVLNVPVSSVEDYAVKKITVIDAAGQACEVYYVLDNFNTQVNKVTSYGWCTTGETGKSIQFKAGEYTPFKVFRYVVVDSFGKSFYGSYYYENLTADEDKIFKLEWNTGENTKSITPVLNGEYNTYSCTAYSSSGDTITDSYAVSNFTDLSNNQITSYVWSDGETGNSIDVPINGEISSYWCTVFDSYDNSCRGYYIIENFEEPSYENQVMSYQWNNGETTQSIITDILDINDQYGVFTCTIADRFGNRVTDSYVIDNFEAPSENAIDSYLWNNGDTSQSIDVNMSSIINDYDIFSCTVFDKWGNECKGHYILSNVDEPENTKIKAFTWNTGELTKSITVDKSNIDEYQTYYCWTQDNFLRLCTDSVVVENFKPITNEISDYIWNTGGTNQYIDVDISDVDEYRVYSCTARDKYGKLTTDSALVCNFKQPSTEITSYSWSTGETAQTIDIDVSNINEYQTYYCTVSNDSGKLATDSIVLTNFHEPHSEIVSYSWNTNDTTQSIDVDISNIDEYKTYYCTATDNEGNLVTDATVITNFHEPHNSIVSYTWNNGAVTETVDIDKSKIDGYQTFYCYVVDEYGNSATDQIVIDNAIPANNGIGYYSWSTGESTQSIDVDLNNIDEYGIFYCTGYTAYDSSVCVTDTTVVTNFKPIVNEITQYRWDDGTLGQTLDVNVSSIDDCRVCSCEATDMYNNTVTDQSVVLKPFNPDLSMTYNWSTGDSTQSITVNLDDVDEYNTYYCTATILGQYSVTDQYVVENFAEIHNDTLLYVWNTGVVAKSIDVDVDSIDSYQVYSCEAITDTGVVTDQYVVTNFKEPHSEIDSYQWDTGETTQSIIVDTSSYSVPELISCTIEDTEGYTTTGFVTVASEATIYTYEWRKGDDTLSLTHDVNVSKNGIYTAIVTNEVGRSVSKDIELTGLGLHPVVDIITDPANIEAGGTMNLKADATDPDGTIVSYKWYKQDNDGTRTLLSEEDSIDVTPASDNEVYVVEVTDDDGYTEENSVTITFIDYSEVLHYSYMGQTYIIPLYAVYKPDSINIRKNGKDYYACYVDEDDPDASDIHVKINNDVKRLKRDNSSNS